MTHQGSGVQSLSQIKDYDSSETNHNTVALNHGYKCSPDGPYNNNPQHFRSCGDKSIDYLQQRYETILSKEAIKGRHFDNQPQIASPFVVFQPGGFKNIHNPHTLNGKYGTDGQRFTYYVENTRSIIHFPKAPRNGDVYCSQHFDNVLHLDIVSTESPRDHHSLSAFGSPRNRNLYRVEEEGGVASLIRMGDEILTFHEENRTATYYLPDKDIALHFTSVPRDGDIFCSSRNDNVVILDILSTGSSLEHHKIHPQDRDLYQFHERNGGFLLMKMDNNNMHSEESYFLGGLAQDENNTVTYYLPDKDMAYHFSRVPTHRDLFMSQKKNNIMILDISPLEKQQEHHTVRSYGSPWDADVYRVQQRDDGFELVMVTNNPVGISAKDKIQQGLKIRRYTASNKVLCKGDNVCAICLIAYKDFDRIGSTDCGHEYHVSCINQWLLYEDFCPICK